MTRSDPYDLHVAFDDLIECTGVDESVQRDDPEASSAAASAILRRARAERLRPRMSYEVLGRDSTRDVLGFYIPGIGIPGIPILGAEEQKMFPCFDRIFRKFRRALPSSRRVRVDDDETYLGFREARQEPYRDRLEERLSALEQAFRFHISDGHGRGSYGLLDADEGLDSILGLHPGETVIDALGEEVATAARESICGGTKIPLGLPSKVSRAVDCWQDGKEICCSIRIEDGRGGVKVLTTGMPVSRAMEDVVECGLELGVGTLDEALPLLPALAERAGGERLLGELASHAPWLRDRDPGTVVRAMPKADPSRASLLMLAQMASRGDGRAREEIVGLAEAGCGEAIRDAGERLRKAQERRCW